MPDSVPSNRVANCFAHRCGVHGAAREAAVLSAAQRIRDSGVDLVRLAWCDVHGALRGKTLTAAAAIQSLMGGVGMVGTLMLKDTSDRTVFKVFEPGGMADMPGMDHGAMASEADFSSPGSVPCQTIVSSSPSRWGCRRRT